MSVNIPEAEGSKIRASLIFDEVIVPVFCDPEEIFECDANDCALELFNVCIKDVIKLSAKSISIDTIKFLKGGKVIVYVVDGKKLYLCAHRIQEDVLKLCKT
jgi:hypothetical protein